MHPILDRLCDFFVYGQPENLSQCAQAFELAFVATQIATAPGAICAVNQLQTLRQDAVLVCHTLLREGFIEVVESASTHPRHYAASEKLTRLHMPAALELSWQERWALANCAGPVVRRVLREKIMLADYTDWLPVEIETLKQHREAFAKLGGGYALLRLHHIASHPSEDVE